MYAEIFKKVTGGSEIWVKEKTKKPQNKKPKNTQKKNPKEAIK
jgi:hypothetical protein